MEFTGNKRAAQVQKMVSLEHRSTYLKELRATTALAEIIDFVIFEKVSSFSDQANLSPSDKSEGIIRSIFYKDLNQFDQIANSYSRKAPEFDSPWINDNYLIYFLILGSKIFNRNVDWLKTVLNKRRVHDREQKLLSDFFSSLLNNVEGSTGELAPLLLTFDYMTWGKPIDSTKIDNALNHILSLTFPPFGDEFLNIMFLKAFDVVIKTKNIEDPQLRKNMEHFRKVFESRIKLLANITVYILLVGFLFIVYLLFKVLFVNIGEVTRNTIVSIMGLLGFTALEALKLKKRILARTISIFYKFFGYQTMALSKKN
jgi:hypothetical protein